MGTLNKQRRRAKKSQRQQERQYAGKGRAGGRWAPPGGEPSLEDIESFSPHVVEALVFGAAHAACEGKDPQPMLDRLLGTGPGRRWSDRVARGISDALTGQLAQVLHQGWEPRDLHAVLRRKVNGGAADIAAASMAEACRRRRPGPTQALRWGDQVASLQPNAKPLSAGPATWPTDMTAAVAVVGVLGHLGPLPELICAAGGGPFPSGLDQGVMDKVRALLAKAEATQFDEEADAFLAKAQELMTRHNLDRAMVQAAGTIPPLIETRRCWPNDPYVKEKGFLLAVVAEANRCRTVSVVGWGLVNLVGHPDDVEVTEMLFTSLLVHATKQMTLGRGPSSSRPWRARPSYRRSFLLAYADRVGARLAEASAAATDMVSRSSRGSLLPVLASREQLVDETISKMFPGTFGARFSATDASGWAAGRAAADLADLADLSFQRRLSSAG
jgi:hypothetical protein